MGLKNRVVVMTGATGGLGQVVAKVFAEQGAPLALLSTSTDKLNALLEELHVPAERSLAHAVDLRDAHATRGAAQAVANKFGHFDILLHFVGGWIGGKSVTEIALEDAESMLGQHLWTTLNLVQAFVPHLLS